MVHIFYILRSSVSVRMWKIDTGSVIIIWRSSAAVGRLVIRFVAGERTGLRAGPGT